MFLVKTMKVWEPKTCCCGISVRVGTLVIGWLGLISSIFSLLSWLRFVQISYDDFAKVCKEAANEIQQPIDVDVCATAAVSIIAVSGVCSGLFVIISALLLVGVNKNKPTLILPFIVIHGIEIVLSCLFILLGFVLLIHEGVAVIAFIFLLVTGMALAVEVYLFLVVRACYNEVKQHVECMGNDSNIPYMEKTDILYKI
ncbi:uncharacterized protein LOC135212671 [Macrobrachium nipponense]|uniref:uncharacterized protein LOC135212671 n=1 Tax=Macrobrachium nipponense TaxID=159736 RepID=UPI0030C84C9D